jgi:CheY-like chemotaxis protein
MVGAQATALRPDLLIVDIMMPQLSGTAMLEKLYSRPEIQATPVILISAWIRPPDHMAAAHFLAKPLTSSSCWMP